MEAIAIISAIIGATEVGMGIYGMTQKPDQPKATPPAQPTQAQLANLIRPGLRDVQAQTGGSITDPSYYASLLQPQTGGQASFGELLKAVQQQLSGSSGGTFGTAGSGGTSSTGSGTSFGSAIAGGQSPTGLVSTGTGFNLTDYLQTLQGQGA